MQSNPLRAALERGELQIGTWVNMVRNPAILTLLKAAGLDFARVDMEHTGADMQEIANLDHATARCRRVEPALSAGGECRARRGDRCGVSVCAARAAGKCGS
jgi:2-keto-3-deoxy-L-rhamnonate aldolase RhmA